MGTLDWIVRSFLFAVDFRIWLHAAKVMVDASR